MKNIKRSKNLVGNKYWPKVAFVDVSGRANVTKLPRDGTEAQMEHVIQTWDDIAVLQVTPNVPFKFGYLQGSAFRYLKETIETDNSSRFGVRIGDDDIRFFVVPESLDRTVDVQLIEQVKESDNKYADLPLY